jgi:hypothetical protein
VLLCASIADQTPRAERSSRAVRMLEALRMVESGLLGRKSGIGFYPYD